VHNYLAEAEHRVLTGQISSNIFERNRQYVDEKLRAIAPDVLEKFISAYRRLAEGDIEARSQALASSRRILKALADHVYPPQDTPVIGPDGKSRELTDEKYVARLWQFVTDKIKGHASGELLLAQITDTGNRIDRVYNLTNKGTHDEVSEFEVNQCVIQTYLLVGDILHLLD
jgi:hypothetical protein